MGIFGKILSNICKSCVIKTNKTHSSFLTYLNNLSSAFFNVLLTVYLSIVLVINQINANIFVYNKFIICLYMFRALHAHHQEVKIVLYSIWYHHTCRWPSGGQVERVPVHRTATYRV